MLDTLGGDLPVPIGGGNVATVARTDVDVMIDNLPFWLALSKDAPYQRETAPYQRDQVDQQPEAGEQSLAGWWTRSQMSFHAGAGLDYLDTIARPDPEDRLRFKTSSGVDVWTPGVVRRLSASALARASSTAGRVWVETADISGVPAIIIARPAGVELTLNEGASWTTVTYGSALAVRAFCVDGASYYAATVDGIYKGPIDGSSPGVKVWDLPGTAVPIVLGWVKQRLMLGHGQKVYSLDAAGPTLPTPRMTHPVTSWTWTAFSEAPTGILACGYAGLSSGMFKFELAAVNDVPILGAGISLLSMPGGEQILAAQQYLGSLLVIGTSRGIRVCPFDSRYGTVSLGPLTLGAVGPVTAVAGYDRFVFGGTRVDGGAQLVRLDLGEPLDQLGHYAWAPDLLPPGPASGAPTAIAFLADGRKVWAVDGVGVYIETGIPYAGDAWLQTARIRVGTVEDKHFAFATIRGELSEAAPVRVEARTAGGDWTQVHTAVTNGERFGLRQPPSEWVELRFHLVDTATVASFQLQALPAGRRQRLISIPVWVTDVVSTRQHRRLGYPGWALERLAALEHIEETGVVVTVSAPALFSDSVQAVVEKLTYVQSESGAYGQTAGRVQVVVRTIS